MGLLSRIKRSLRRFIVTESKPKRKQRLRQKNCQNMVRIDKKNRIFLAMANNERRKRQLHPLKYDPSLERHARNWSKHMASQRKLSHSGYILENACMVSSNGSNIAITKKMFKTWKKSRPHWNWMMDPSIYQAGFGYSKRGKYAYGAFAFK